MNKTCVSVFCGGLLLKGLFVASISLFGTAVADVAAAEKGAVYIVDMQRIIDESLLGQSAKSDIEQSAKKFRVQQEKAQAELKRKETEIRKGASVLSGEALEKKTEAFRREAKDLQRDLEDKRDTLVAQRNRALANVVEKIREEVAKLAEEKGYEVVIERDARVVAYYNEQYDITQRVVERVNKQRLGY